jgi:transketolase
VAAGLAREGFKVFVYAIAPFITLRCYEQLRVSAGIMRIPMTILGMGTGLGYCTDGPTHHLIEDLAVMRVLPGCQVIALSDAEMAVAAADYAINRCGFNYIRLDKDAVPALYKNGFDTAMFDAGCYVLADSGRDVLLLASAPMITDALDVVRAHYAGRGIAVADVFRYPLSREVSDLIASARTVVTVEEHFSCGGLFTAVCELMGEASLWRPVKRVAMSMENGYKPSYAYGGRDITRSAYGVSCEAIATALDSALQQT